jgi:hypothetical protein
MATETRFKFGKTALQALALPDPGKRLTLYDTEGAEAGAAGDGGGQQDLLCREANRRSMAWVKLGSFPDMTVEQARREAEKTLGEFASGNDLPLHAKRSEASRRSRKPSRASSTASASATAPPWRTRPSAAIETWRGSTWARSRTRSCRPSPART